MNKVGERLGVKLSVKVAVVNVLIHNNDLLLLIIPFIVLRYSYCTVP